MAELRISSGDGFDLRKLATALAESQGWPRERISVWDKRDGEVILTVEDALLTRTAADPMNQPVHTRSDVHEACELLRRRDASLYGVEFSRLRDEASRFFSAGWSIADLLHALSMRPDGAPWARGEGYQGPEWLDHRLRNWKTPTGDIRPSVSQENAQLRVVGRSGLPEGIGLPRDDAPRGQAARPESARAAADDARRLMRAHARTTSNTLEHRDRTAAKITKGEE
ncbi:hypothetical protein [Nocardiopsis ansamitocini]|uniref:Uncharacterized protein n=1 Tax=Nocardiopsis ansamitocini TaxID=1670832 RepID=A0A9W6P6C4_9ACTN|nr:hypothetical protein [Nocardiopsis ansamitocini]GLU47828.1 hypothetical protein Nans01_21790 [Nocardiopsis ansamitocini]